MHSSNCIVLDHFVEAILESNNNNNNNRINYNLTRSQLDVRLQVFAMHNAAGTLSIAHVAKQINASLQIQAEIDEFPFYSFTLVFFLFKNEHVMVEELLQTFVDKIDPQLFK
ncbi:hypothetical protein T11_5517 [Trichinella zimbabwensis]|uniref:Uncharacterized protein n=1 Tax=Trichinella zimbabwensis TaxID=268475 RepID=A0A0V1HEX3_9BILA|nr:hypothetical protein T11_5517 [Trichinella zimbabwensis]